MNANGEKLMFIKSLVNGSNVYYDTSTGRTVIMDNEGQLEFDLLVQDIDWYNTGVAEFENGKLRHVPLQSDKADKVIKGFNNE